jgi:hypothetical protein
MNLPATIMTTTAGASNTAITRKDFDTKLRKSDRARTPSAKTAEATEGLTMKKAAPIISVT